MLVFRFADLVSILLLGEIVGLFAYAILRAQAEKLPLTVADLPFVIFAIGVPLVAAALFSVAYVLGKKVRPVFFQFGKFAAVGFSNTAIDWGVLNLLLIPFGLATGTYAVGKAVSFAVATLNSFFWNRFWSFERKGTEKIGSEAVRFYLVTAIGLAINVGVATSVKVLGPETRLWAGIIAPAAATIVSLVWNFVGYKFFVFRQAPSNLQPY